MQRLDIDKALFTLGASTHDCDKLGTHLFVSKRPVGCYPWCAEGISAVCFA